MLPPTDCLRDARGDQGAVEAALAGLQRRLPVEPRALAFQWHGTGAPARTVTGLPRTTTSAASPVSRVKVIESGSAETGPGCRAG